MIESIAGNPDKERRIEYVIALVVVSFFGAMTWQFLADESSPISFFGDKGVLLASPERSDVSGVAEAEKGLSSTQTIGQLSARLEQRATRIVRQDMSPRAIIASSTQMDVERGSNSAAAPSRVSPITLPEQLTLEADTGPTTELPIDEARTSAAVVPLDELAIVEPMVAEPVPVEPASIEKTQASDRVAVVDETEITSPADTALSIESTIPIESASRAELVSSVGSLVDAEVLFAEASVELSQNALRTLEQFFAVLVKYPELNLRISGYADPVGSAEINRQLSEERALACRDFLSDRGIDGSRLFVESFGETQVGADAMTEEFLQGSRRVELRLEL
jgi:outer membrane protein OmpA-like peptidoglycan-associated protein